MKLEIVNKEGQKTGKKINLPDEVFGIEPNEHAVYLAVKQYNANQRQGTHSSKGRSDVAGSTRKIKRQKGTGTARAGDIKNPLFRGGGRMFGPQPRDYSLKLNKKVKILARNSALSSKASAGQIVVIEDFTFEKPSTREYFKVLENLNLSDQKTLLVTCQADPVLVLASRNLKKANVTRVEDLNTYSVLNAKTLILAESTIEKFKETFA
jgi:large subunit ribosomal protein L4